MFLDGLFIYAFMPLLVECLLVCSQLRWLISLLYHTLECIVVISCITAQVAIVSTLDSNFQPTHPFRWCQKGKDEYNLISIGSPSFKFTS